MGRMDRNTLKIIKNTPLEVNSLANYDISDNYKLLPTSI